MTTTLGTKEWASRNVNIQTGCEHRCRYCYASWMASRFRGVTPEQWSNPVIRRNSVDRNYRKADGRIMFPSSHDITPLNIGECIVVLRKLLQAGNEVVIVSKPHFACVSRLCSEFYRRRSKIIMRFTIGSQFDATLAYWEPGAPFACDRVKCIQMAFTWGFSTSVSCEPYHDADDAIIKAVRPYVTDSIWIGKANNLERIIAVNCPGDADALQRARELVEQQARVLPELHRLYDGDPLIRWKQ